MNKCSRFSSAAAVLACCCITVPASAADFTVNSLLDVIPAGDSNPGDGICEDIRSGSRCTLRAAIEETNARAGADRILFSVAGEIAIIEGALPAITDRLTLLGSSAPGYVEGATLGASPPVVFLTGTLLGGTIDGLRFRNAASSLSQVVGLGIVRFGGSGIESGTNAGQLWIRRNYIGVEADGTAAGNGTGLFLVGNDNQVGFIGPQGTSTGMGNVVSSSTGDGITLVGSGNRVRGNLVGLHPAGSGDRGNGGRGIVVVGSQNLVGDSTTGTGNVVTYNGSDGVAISGSANLMLGNSIGTAAISTFGNRGNGLALVGHDNVIGDVSGASRNLMWGNDLAGVIVGTSGAAADRNLVVGNSVRANDASGLRVERGDATRILRNIVNSNGLDGIRLGSSTTSSSVAGNHVGVQFAMSGGVYASGNASNGITDLGTGSTIGFDEAGGASGPEANIIGFNNVGVYLGGDGALMQGNHVGTNGEGTDMGNLVGLYVAPSASGSIIDANLVGFSTGVGIAVSGDGSTLCGNLAGTTDTLLDVGNGLAGILLLANDTNVGEGCSAPNMVGFNGSHGVEVEGSGNRVFGNLIGESASGVPIGNQGDGVHLLDSLTSGNHVRENLIAHNGGNGIRVAESAGSGNRLRRNRMHDNDGFGVDLGPAGPTPNDIEDADSGPNNLQNTPVIDFANIVDGALHVQFRVEAAAGNTALPLDIDFYLADGTGRRQGHRFLTTRQFEFAGTYVYTNLGLPSGTTGGLVLAMATDADGNSSEFSAELVFGSASGIFDDGFEAAP